MKTVTPKSRHFFARSTVTARSAATATLVTQTANTNAMPAPSNDGASPSKSCETPTGVPASVSSAAAMLPNAKHYESDWWRGAVVHGRPTEW